MLSLWADMKPGVELSRQGNHRSSWANAPEIALASKIELSGLAYRVDQRATNDDGNVLNNGTLNHAFCVERLEVGKGPSARS